MNREMISENKIQNLIDRNRGRLSINPILDSWDEDPFTDVRTKHFQKIFRDR
jgi:hypothetical protein